MAQRRARRSASEDVLGRVGLTIAWLQAGEGKSHWRAKESGIIEKKGDSKVKTRPKDPWGWERKAQKHTRGTSALPQPVMSRRTKAVYTDVAKRCQGQVLGVGKERECGMLRSC